MFAAMLLLSYAITSSFSPVQSPSPPSWDILANESNAIIVGVVEKTSSVIRRDKMVSTSKPLPNGNIRVELPDPRNYVVGHVVQIRVEEILKNDGKVKTKGIVSIYLPGWFPMEGQPSFVEKERYLVFLSPFKADSQNFEGTTIFQPNPSVKDQSFSPASKYVVVRDGGGAVNLTSRNDVLNEVKTVLNKPR